MPRGTKRSMCLYLEMLEFHILRVGHCEENRVQSLTFIVDMMSFIMTSYIYTDEILVAEQKEQSSREPMELHLGDLKITFDLHCLTLQTDSESQTKPEFHRMMSSTSSDVESPPPDSETACSTQM